MFSLDNDRRVGIYMLDTCLYSGLSSPMFSLDNKSTTALFLRPEFSGHLVVKDLIDVTETRPTLYLITAK